MSQDISAPLIIILAVLVYGLVHSILASLRAKARAGQLLGLAGRRGYRLAFNLFAALSLLPVLALPALLPDETIYTIPFPWTLLTLGLQGLAGVALVAGVFQTGAASFIGLKQLFVEDIDSASRLVVRGLYRWVRHPLYTAGLVFIWLIPVMTRNILALNVGLTLYIWIGAWTEERKLLVEFGDVYAHYREHVPMFIPGIKIHR